MPIQIERWHPGKVNRIDVSTRPKSKDAKPLSGAERRREPRVSGHELVVAHWTDSDGRARAERVSIVDRSEKGIGLHLTVPIPVGAEVDISGGTTVRARVRHCRADREAYTVGLHRLSADTYR